MSLTAITWILLFTVMTVMAFKRASWGLAVYMLTYFALPDIWWWGRSSLLFGQRWNLAAGCILLVAVVMQHLSEPRESHPVSRFGKWLAAGLLVNAAFVHLVMAPYAAISSPDFWLLAKFVVLFFLIVGSIRSRDDLLLLLVVLALGAGYIGYEATINQRGSLAAGRLEGIGTPSARSANGLACLALSILPMTGALFFVGDRRHKLVVLLCAPFIVNLILLCNSRGALLALLVAAGVLILVSAGKQRARALWALCLGGALGILLLNDPHIVRRFMTTFAEQDDRDAAASSRLIFWRAGLRVIADHPLGTGGDGYQIVYGPSYLAREGVDVAFRSVHNGFIDDACEWGIQGFLLRAVLYVTAVLAVWRSARSVRSRGDPKFSFLGQCILASLTALFTASIFGDYFAAEWGYWLIAIALGYARLSEQPTELELAEFAEAEQEEYEAQLIEEHAGSEIITVG